MEKMESIELATWILTFFTMILAFATIVYAIVTYKTYKASKDQVKALNELTKAILEIPNIQASIQYRMEKNKELSDKQSKIKTVQQKAVTGL
jgi:hypothetical protein